MTNPGDSASKQSVADQFNNNVETLVESRIVWHTGNFPPDMTSVVNLAGNDINAFDPNDITINPATASQVSQLLRDLTQLYGKVRKVRYRRLLQTDGAPSVQFDQTNVTSLADALYEQIPVDNSITFDLISDEKREAVDIDGFIADLQTQWDNVMEENLVNIDFVFCHSSCHSSCHGSRSRR